VRRSQGSGSCPATTPPGSTTFTIRFAGRPSRRRWLGGASADPTRSDDPSAESQPGAPRFWLGAVEVGKGVVAASLPTVSRSPLFRIRGSRSRRGAREQVRPPQLGAGGAARPCRRRAVPSPPWRCRRGRSRGRRRRPRRACARSALTAGRTRTRRLRDQATLTAIASVSDACSTSQPRSTGADSKSSRPRRAQPRLARGPGPGRPTRTSRPVPRSSGY
jgi:hypothetical protein